MPYTLIVDVLVAVLLVITIGYAIVLNKRLGRLRRDKAALEKLARTFGDSTARAEESIEKLKATAELLDGRMDKAEALRDDLAFLLDRGSKAADRLENLIRDARERAGVGPRPAPMVSDISAHSNKGPASHRPLTPLFDDAGPDAEADSNAGTKAGLRAKLERAPGHDAGAEDAEQELLRAIRSAN